MMSSSISSNISEMGTISGALDVSKVPHMINDEGIYKEIDDGVVTLLTNLFHKKSFTTIIEIAHEVLEDNPKSIFTNNVIAESYAKLGDNMKAIKYYEKTIALMPFAKDWAVSNKYLPNIHNNLGVALKAIGLLDKSEDILKKAISLDPKSSSVYNNYGNLLSDKAETKKAQKCFLKSIDLDPGNFSAYWNLHSTVDDFDQAKQIIELCIEQAPQHLESIFTLAGINAFAGKHTHFDKLMETEYVNNPILTSIKWILSLPELPEIHFNRWSVFDRAVELSDTKRPFY
jgi:tetratricopeptide (TPR) repeat protein